MRKVPLGRMEGFARAEPAKPLPDSITTVPAGWALSQHEQQFVLASEGALWRVLIPAPGQAPQERGEAPTPSPGSSRDTEHPKAAALCNPHTKRWSLLMGLPA